MYVIIFSSYLKCAILYLGVDNQTKNQGSSNMNVIMDGSIVSPQKINMALGGTPTYPSAATGTAASSLSSKPTGGNVEAVISPPPPPGEKPSNEAS